MAGRYILPQIRVFQEFAMAPNDVTQNLNPFIIGPNYQLIRYSSPDERVDCTHKTYAGAAITLPWATGYEGSVVDLGWFGVTLANAMVKLGAPLNATCLDADVYGTKFEFKLDEGKSLIGPTADKCQFQTPVKPGDFLQYSVTEGEKTVTKRTKIKDISAGTLVFPGEISYTLKTKAGDDASGKFTVGLMTYKGEKPVKVKLSVKSQDSKLMATWSSNVAGIAESTAKEIPASSASAPLDLGLGLTLTKSTGAEAGDYVIVVSISEAHVKDTVTVTDNVKVTSKMTFTFVRAFDAVEVAEEDLTATDDGVTVTDGVKVPLGSLRLDVVEAEAYLTQRNFVRKHTDGIYTISSDADIIRELGAITPDNPLAYGAYIMRLNCATAAIRYLALESDDTAGWATALKRASVSNDVYAFCPLTEDRTILDSVVAHCEKMSAPEEKSWRIAFFSTPTDEKIDVTPRDDGVAEKCKVDAKRILTCDSVNAKFVDTVHVGDAVTIVNTVGVSVETTVKAVKSNTTLELKDAVADATSALCAFTIIHTREVEEYVSAIAATSMSFRNRRAYNVFPNTLRNTDGVFVSGMYGAAAVCGLACSVLPQQPITNVEIKGFADVPDVYSKYSRDQLNKIAEGGTLILMQDRIGGTVYVRHQISTAYADGNLNSTELSLVKNLDSVSYYFANRFAPYNGRYNVSDDLLTELRGILKDGIAHLSTAPEGSKLVGPQVHAEGTEVRSLYRDTTEKDRVCANVALNLPAPFNNFDLHLQVI